MKHEHEATLVPGEVHPASHSAMTYVTTLLNEDIAKALVISETLASLALAGNRLAEICHSTLVRLMKAEPISDRYLLGLAWMLKEMDEYESTKNHQKNH